VHRILAYNDKCGDGYTDAGEQCDDGNLISGDGCSSTCTIETYFTCVQTYGFAVCTENPDKGVWMG
jgi:cysteine-rich repeat protein